MFHAKLNISAIIDLIRFQDVAASGTTPPKLVSAIYFLFSSLNMNLV